MHRLSADPGCALLIAGETTQAEQILAAVLDAPTIGNEHPLIAQAYALQAQVHAEQSRWDEAIADHQAAYDRYVVRFGPEHINAAGRLGDIGLALGYANRLEEAKGYFARAIADLRRTQDGHSDASRAMLYENLGWVEMNLGNLEAAERAFDDADSWSEGLPNTDPHRNNWRTVARGRIAEARGQYERAHAHFVRAKKLAVDDTERIAAEVGLSIAALHIVDRADAHAQLLDALDHPRATALEKARAAWGIAIFEQQRDQTQTARRSLQQARAFLEEAAFERIELRKIEALEHSLGPSPRGG